MSTYSFYVKKPKKLLHIGTIVLRATTLINDSLLHLMTIVDGATTLMDDSSPYFTKKQQDKC